MHNNVNALKNGVVMHAYNPRTQEADAGGPRIQARLRHS